MKKLISIFAVIVFASVEASAATCESLGYTVGTMCDTSSHNVPVALCCTATVPCKCVYYNDAVGTCQCGVMPASCSSGQYSMGSLCKSCLEYSDENGGTFSAIESESPFSMSDCFVPTSASITDSSGTFSFTTKCNFSLL